MAGSGGGYFSANPERIIDKIKKSQENTKTSEVDSAVSGEIAALLSAYNSRDHERIADLLDGIQNALGKDIDGTISLGYAGSVSKHTYVDGISDVDALVFINDCDLVDVTPAQAKEYLFRRLMQRYPTTDITQGAMAVTVRFRDAEVQLLPVVRCGDKIKVSDATGDKWSLVDPSGFSRSLTKINQVNGGKVVPVIKLVKAIVSKLPDNQRLSGYHVESLAVSVFKDYQGAQNSKAMLRHFFETAPTAVLQPIRDRSGQSVHVDEYLGPEGSLNRMIISDALQRIARKMRNADASGSVREWSSILS